MIRNLESRKNDFSTISKKGKKEVSLGYFIQVSLCIHAFLVHAHQELKKSKFDTFSSDPDYKRQGTFVLCFMNPFSTVPWVTCRHLSQHVKTMIT